MCECQRSEYKYLVNTLTENCKALMNFLLDLLITRKQLLQTVLMKGNLRSTEVQISVKKNLVNMIIPGLQAWMSLLLCMDPPF